MFPSTPFTLLLTKFSLSEIFRVHMLKVWLKKQFTRKSKSSRYPSMKGQVKFLRPRDISSAAH